MKSLVDLKKLELFRDFKIPLLELNNSGKLTLYNAKKVKGQKVEVCIEHVINVLNKYKNKQITQQVLLEWIYTIHLCNLFENCSDYDESILQIFEIIEETATNTFNILDGNNLESIKIVKVITDSDIDKYIGALQNNIQLIAI